MRIITPIYLQYYNCNLHYIRWNIKLVKATAKCQDKATTTTTTKPDQRFEGFALRD